VTAHRRVKTDGRSGTPRPSLPPLKRRVTFVHSVAVRAIADKRVRRRLAAPQARLPRGPSQDQPAAPSYLPYLATVRRSPTDRIRSPQHHASPGPEVATGPSPDFKSSPSHPSWAAVDVGNSGP